MKYVVFLAAVCAVTIQARAQKAKFKASYGDLTSEEINMQYYAGDSSANAVYLFNIGSVLFDENVKMTAKTHARIKFFGTEDIWEYSSVRILLRTGYQTISKIRATTYNFENGKMIESRLGEEGIFRSKFNKSFTLVQFTFPNVKPGSIVEYSYSIVQEQNLAIHPWKFQHSIPTIYTEYEAAFPNFCIYKKEIMGFLPLSDYISENDGSYEKLIMRDVPAFVPEPFITTSDDFVAGVNYYIMAVQPPSQAFSSPTRSGYILGRFHKLERTWKEIGKLFYSSEDFGVHLQGNLWLDQVVDAIIAGAPSDEEKARRIHDYVASNFIWNEQVDIFPENSLRKVFDYKNGSSSELNMLLISMMRRAKLDASAVLLSTRSNGIIRNIIPDRWAFNDVLCLVRINGKSRLFDATDKNLPYSALPERVLNGEGLIVAKDTAQWIPLTANKARIVYSADLKILDNGELEGKLSISREGLYEGDMRSSYSSLGKDKYISTSLANKTWEVTSSKFENMDSINAVPLEIHDVVIRDHAVANGDIIYINPYITGHDENPFKSQVRDYPVFMPTPFDKSYTARLEIPAGYKVEELPPNKLLVLPEGAGKFIYTTTVLGNTVNFTSQLSITKNVITPDKYARLREFYVTVVAKQAEQIVLKKLQ